MSARLNLDWITVQLAVGGSFPKEAAPELAQALGVRRVVDVRLEDCDDAALLERHGIMLLHLPTEDRCALSLDALDRGVDWVSAELARGEKILIHCEHGIGRSALLACCVLVRHGHAPHEALAKAKRARAQVSPSPKQLEGLIAWAERERSRTRAPLRLPTLEELFEIAYARPGGRMPG